MNHIGLYVIYYCLIITYLAAMIEGGLDIYRQLNKVQENISPSAPPIHQIKENTNKSIFWNVWVLFATTIIFGIFITLLEAIMFWLGIR